MIQICIATSGRKCLPNMVATTQNTRKKGLKQEEKTVILSAVKITVQCWKVLKNLLFASWQPLRKSGRSQYHLQQGCPTRHPWVLFEVFFCRPSEAFLLLPFF